MRRAASKGKPIGRPKGKEDERILLERYPAVVDALRQGLSLRQAARQSNVALNTVVKVKAILDRSADLSVDTHRTDSDFSGENVTKVDESKGKMMTGQEIRILKVKTDEERSKLIDPGKRAFTDKAFFVNFWIE